MTDEKVDDLLAIYNTCIGADALLISKDCFIISLIAIKAHIQVFHILRGQQT
jgi:hypothetical protein